MSAGQFSVGWKRRLAGLCVLLPLLAIFLTVPLASADGAWRGEGLVEHLAKGLVLWAVCGAVCLTIHGFARTLQQQRWSWAALWFVPWAIALAACFRRGTPWISGVWLRREQYDARLLLAMAGMTAAFAMVLTVYHCRVLLEARGIARREHAAFIAAAKGSQQAVYLCRPVYRSGAIADFRIAYVNAAAERMLGRRGRDIVGRSMSALVPAGNVRELRERWGEVAQTGVEADVSLTVKSLGGGETTHATHVVKLGYGVAVAVAQMSEERRAALRARDLNDFAQSIIASAPVSMIATDVHGTIVAMNEAAEALTQYRKSELVGEQSLLVLHDVTEISSKAMQWTKEMGGSATPGFQALIAKVRDGTAEEREATYVKKDGSRVWVNLTMAKLRTGSEGTTGYLAIAFDVTEKKRLADSVAHMAHHDQLTGLVNRAVLKERLEQGIERAKRTRQRMAIFVVDIDHFKRINDSLGHTGGDELLVFVARQLQAAVRQADLVARVGGDEFVVVMQEFREAADAEGCADLMLQKVATPVMIQGREVRVTASIGFCLYPEGADDAAAMLRNADSAMYEAKNAGKAARHQYSREMERDASARLEMEEDLRHALDRKEFKLSYQAQVDCLSGEVTGMESLLRWESRKRGLVAPGDFIPVAEEIGLMGPIGEWTILQSCRDCAEMQREMGRRLTVAVNLSPRQLGQKSLAGLVARALQSSGLSAGQLEVEITEQMLMVNSANTLMTLAAIRELGVCIAIDDFGTGFSSLSYILQYKVDRIKIDRSFVERATDDPNAAAVVRTIIAMGHGLNMRVVAEGVETAEQYDFLLERQCDDMQGFLFAKPVGKKEFVRRAKGIGVEQRQMLRRLMGAEARPGGFV